MKKAILNSVKYLLLIICVLSILYMTICFIGYEYVYAVGFKDVDCIVSENLSIPKVRRADGSLWRIENPTNAYLETEDDNTVIKVTSRNSLSATLFSDGTLNMSGDNTYGQIGDGTSDYRNPSSPFNVASVIQEKIVDVKLGYEMSAALTEDGSLYMWGSNRYGQLGDGTTQNRTTPYKVMDNVAMVGLGDYHVAAVKTDGGLWLWGRNNNGQIGNKKTEEYCDTPQRIVLDDESQINIKDVSLGSEHTAVLDENGRIWTWGANNNGQLGIGTTTTQNKPVMINTEVMFKSIKSYSSYNTAIDNNNVLWMWGYNAYIDPIKTSQKAPLSVLTEVKMVDLTGRICIAAMKSGRLAIWGYNYSKTSGKIFGDPEDVQESDADGDLLAKNLTDVKKIILSNSLNFSVAVKNDGTLWSWGNNHNGSFLGYQHYFWDYTDLVDHYRYYIKSSSRPNRIETIDDVQDAVINWDGHIIVLKKDGSVWSKESNESNSFSKISILENIKTISSGQYHYAALNEDGQLYIWGDNSYGQIGDGTTTDRYSPYSVPLGPIKQVCLGDNHTVVLTENGDVYTWGDNDWGQIGDGTFNVSSTPVKINSDLIDGKVVTVKAGGNSTAAITEDGSLYVWGDYLNKKHYYPDHLDDSIADIQFCNGCMAVLTKAGELMMGGNNSYHQINESNQSFVKYPTPVMENIYFRQIGLGYTYAGGVKKDGSILLWGDDTNGQLGDGKIGEGEAESGGNGHIRVKMSYDDEYADSNKGFFTISGANSDKKYYSEESEFLLDRDLSPGPYYISVGTDRVGYSLSANCTVTKEGSDPVTSEVLTGSYVRVDISKNDNVTVALVCKPVRDKGNLKIKATFDDTITDEDKENIEFTVSGPDNYSKSIKYFEFTNDAYELSDLVTGEYIVTEKDAEADEEGYSIKGTFTVNGRETNKATVTKDNTVVMTVAHKYEEPVVEKGTLKIQAAFDDTLTPDEKKTVNFKVSGPESFNKSFSKFVNGMWDIGEVVAGKYAIEVDAPKKENYHLVKTITVKGKEVDTVSVDKNESITVVITIKYQQEIQPDVDIKPTVKLAKGEYAYNKKNIRPLPLVMAGNDVLEPDKDYAVTYSKAKSSVIGTYKLTVKGIGDYKGKLKKTLTYKVVPDKVTLKKAISLYKKSLKQTVVNIYVKSRLIKPAKKNKVYYEVAVYSDKALKKKAIKKNKKLYGKDRFKKGFYGIKYHFKKGKRYYIRIRTVKGAYKGDWSKVKSFKGKG